MEYLEYITEWVLGCIYHDGFIETNRGDDVNRVIAEAVDKQRPKKPNKAMNSNDEFEKYKCPRCGGFLIKNYPCKCGQMIDWSDEE